MQILFVEDDAMNRLVVRNMLTVVGVDMEEAEDAVKGMAMIDGSRYDVVLMDLRMPGMDGFAAIRQIRQRPDDKAEVPIIVITADTGIDLLARCRDSGANHVLSKPVAMDALFDTLCDVLPETAFA